MAEIQSLLQRYQDNHVLRALLQIVQLGIGAAADVYLIQTLKMIKNERLQTYFDELAAGHSIVDEDLLMSEDFLHSYALTTRLALNTRRREEIRMFARLLKNSVSASAQLNSDEYEEYATILVPLHRGFDGFRRHERVHWRGAWGRRGRVFREPGGRRTTT